MDYLAILNEAMSQYTIIVRDNEPHLSRPMIIWSYFLVLEDDISESMSVFINGFTSWSLPSNMSILVDH